MVKAHRKKNKGSLMKKETVLNKIKISFIEEKILGFPKSIIF